MKLKIKDVYLFELTFGDPFVFTFLFFAFVIYDGIPMIMLGGYPIALSISPRGFHIVIYGPDDYGVYIPTQPTILVLIGISLIVQAPAIFLGGFRWEFVLLGLFILWMAQYVTEDEDEVEDNEHN